MDNKVFMLTFSKRIEALSSKYSKEEFFKVRYNRRKLKNYLEDFLWVIAPFRVPDGAELTIWKSCARHSTLSSSCWVTFMAIFFGSFKILLAKERMYMYQITGKFLEKPLAFGIIPKVASLLNCTVFENHPKCRIWEFLFWHFPPISMQCWIRLFLWYSNTVYRHHS